MGEENRRSAGRKAYLFDSPDQPDFLGSGPCKLGPVPANRCCPFWTALEHAPLPRQAPASRPSTTPAPQQATCGWQQTSRQAAVVWLGVRLRRRSSRACRVLLVSPITLLYDIRHPLPVIRQPTRDGKYTANTSIWFADIGASALWCLVRPACECYLSGIHFFFFFSSRRTHTHTLASLSCIGQGRPARFLLLAVPGWNGMTMEADTCSFLEREGSTAPLDSLTNCVASCRSPPLCARAEVGDRPIQQQRKHQTHHRLAGTHPFRPSQPQPGRTLQTKFHNASTACNCLHRPDPVDFSPLHHTPLRTSRLDRPPPSWMKPFFPSGLLSPWLVDTGWSSPSSGPAQTRAVESPAAELAPVLDPICLSLC